MRFFFRPMTILTAVVLLETVSSDLFSQTKALKELNTSYPLGGSSSFFWVAYRSGSFERQGLKLKPILIPGGVTAVQSLLAKEVSSPLPAG